METYGVELEEPQPVPEPLQGQTPFSDSPAATRREAAMRLALSTVRRMIDEDAFEVWRLPIESAARQAFGDIDLSSEDAFDRFSERAPVFLKALPGVMDATTPKSFSETLQKGLLAAFLSNLPRNFTARRGTPK